MLWEEELKNGTTREWDCEFSIQPYTPANFRGHPDNWSPEEGGETELTAMRATIRGKRVTLNTSEATQRFGAETITDIEAMAAEAFQYDCRCDDGPDPDDERDREIDRQEDRDYNDRVEVTCDWD